jgi:hypothetical protein
MKIPALTTAIAVPRACSLTRVIAAPAPNTQNPPTPIPSTARAASIIPMSGARPAITSETTTSALRPTSTLRRSSRAEHRVSAGAATAAVTAGTTTISPPVPTETPQVPADVAEQPHRDHLREHQRELPAAGGHASRPGGPVTFSSATYVIYHVTVNVMYHVIIDWEGRRRARLPVCLRAAAVGIREAGAGASRRLTGGRASARSAGSIGHLVEGAGAPDSGLQAPGMGAAGGTSGHGAWRRRSDADRFGLAGRAAGRGTGPGQAGGDVHLVCALLR